MSTLIPMKPSDVLRLAEAELEKMHAQRKAELSAALEAAHKELRWVLFPFISVRKYKTAEEAVLGNWRCSNAYNYARDDIAACKMLKAAAEHVLQAFPTDPPELLVSLDDFRALT